MTKKQRRQYDKFFSGTFTSGGIFDEPAKVTFKEPQRKAPPKVAIHVQQTTVQKLDPAIAAKIKKMEAVINDPAASIQEKETATRLIEKLERKGASN